MTLLRLALLALVTILATASRSQASCNTIPERPLFRGERGSIDRPFLSPDADQRVTISYGSGDAAARAVLQGDALVTLVFKPPGATAYTYYIAPTDKACRRLARPRRGFKELFCHASRNCVTAREVGLEIDSSRSQLSFRPPYTRAAGPVTIAVTNSSRPPLELQLQSCSMLLSTENKIASPANPANPANPMMAAMSTEPASAKESPDDADIVVCIDAVSSNVDSQQDSSASALLYLPPAYDYKEVCTQQLEDPKCLGSASDIDVTMDMEGNVAVRVLWEGILLKKQAAPVVFREREILAAIAVGAQAGELDRIRIPSSAFLRTTTIQESDFNPAPKFDPAENPLRPNEQIFAGTADKGDSVLRFARRKRWQYVCSGGTRNGQACDPAANSTTNDECPSGQCAQSSSPPEYFACVGGNRHRLPCTRTGECTGTGATCEAISKKGNICYLFGGTEMSPQKDCLFDTDCDTGAGPGVGVECGPGLFDFRNRADIPIVNGVVKIKRQANQVRGVCDGGDFEGVKCTSTSFCATRNSRWAKCVRFRASALLSKP